MGYKRNKISVTNNLDVSGNLRVDGTSTLKSVDITTNLNVGGNIILNSTPTDDTHVTNKLYIDNAISSVADQNLPENNHRESIEISFGDTSGNATIDLTGNTGDNFFVNSKVVTKDITSSTIGAFIINALFERVGPNINLVSPIQIQKINDGGTSKDWQIDIVGGVDNINIKLILSSGASISGVTWKHQTEITII
jgi:hypothetical protein